MLSDVLSEMGAGRRDAKLSSLSDEDDDGFSRAVLNDAVLESAVLFDRLRSRRGGRKIGPFGRKSC